MAKPEHSPASIVRAASAFSAARRAMRASFAEGKQLGPSAWLRLEILKFIAEKGSPLMREVAEHLCIAAPSATSLVAGLTKDGLVRRVPDANDRRTSRITLTKKGQSELARAIERGVARLATLFIPLSAAELVTLTKLLERLHADTGSC